MQTINEAFRDRSYMVLYPALPGADLKRLEQELNTLVQGAHESRPPGAGSASRVGDAGLIVVPEASEPSQICRLEYLAGASAWVREHLVPRLAQLASAVAGEPMVLFKDKCNLKHPGGGEFAPHQDIAAYLHFGTSFHVTAAVVLDPATAENGALEMARYWNKLPAGTEGTATPNGLMAVLPYEEGGPRNGDIRDAYLQDAQWELITANAGSIVLFDSYVPHRSARNNSSKTRRILFFTFNLAREGDHYERYYEAKRRAPNNPIFHVSTPTFHSAL